jgi:hypothetical protein
MKNDTKIIIVVVIIAIVFTAIFFSPSDLSIVKKQKVSSGNNLKLAASFNLQTATYSLPSQGCIYYHQNIYRFKQTLNLRTKCGSLGKIPIGISSVDDIFFINPQGNIYLCKDTIDGCTASMFALSSGSCEVIVKDYGNL